VPIDSVLAHDLRLLRNLGIKQEWFERYPQELSGGELQRFCIARALLAHPRYLIADEISTMLDGITQARLWQVILDETTRARIGLVFTTHSESLATHLMQF
jgi:peptide/nickel transport system ATP-binding protein